MNDLPALLDEIGWSTMELSRRARVSERTARRWTGEPDRYPTPAPILAWLGRVAAWMRDNPAP